MFERFAVGRRYMFGLGEAQGALRDSGKGSICTFVAVGGAAACRLRLKLVARTRIELIGATLCRSRRRQPNRAAKQNAVDSCGESAALLV